MESGLPIFRQNFTCSALLKLEAFAGPVRDYHPLGYYFPTISGYKRFETGLVRFRSPLLTESLRFPFLWLMRCFSSPGLLQRSMYSSVDTRLWSGFPHSEIPASKPIGGSAGLIAAYHVLHRLCMPRHPPNALLCLKSTPFAAFCLGRLSFYKKLPVRKPLEPAGHNIISQHTQRSRPCCRSEWKNQILAACWPHAGFKKPARTRAEPLYVYKPRFPTASALPHRRRGRIQKKHHKTACGKGHKLLSTIWSSALQVLFSFFSKNFF